MTGNGDGGSTIPELPRSGGMNISEIKKGDKVLFGAAQAAFEPEFVQECLQRHAQGDWGVMCDEDKALNDAGLDPEHPDRLHSAYQTPGGQALDHHRVGPVRDDGTPTQRLLETLSARSLVKVSKKLLNSGRSGLNRADFDS